MQERPAHRIGARVSAMLLPRSETPKPEAVHPGHIKRCWESTSKRLKAILESSGFTYDPMLCMKRI